MASKKSARYSRSLSMDYFGFLRDPDAEVVVEAAAHKLVSRMAEYLGQFVIHLLQCYEANPCIRGGVDQHINIAVSAEIIPNGGAKNVKLTYGMRST